MGFKNGNKWELKSEKRGRKGRRKTGKTDLLRTHTHTKWDNIVIYIPAS